MVQRARRLLNEFKQTNLLIVNCVDPTIVIASGPYPFLIHR